MQHFAEIDDENRVLRVITVADSDCLNELGNISETVGEAFCNRITDSEPFTKTSKWRITYPHRDHFPRDPNNLKRKNFAGKGDFFDEERNAFYSDKPYDNWIFNEENCRWEPPVPHPNDGKIYTWSQEETKWVYL